MKKLFLGALSIILVSGCSAYDKQMQQAIQMTMTPLLETIVPKAIAQTQTAMPTPTFTPSPTATDDPVVVCPGKFMQIFNNWQAIYERVNGFLIGEQLLNNTTWRRESLQQLENLQEADKKLLNVANCSGAYIEIDIYFDQLAKDTEDLVNAYTIYIINKGKPYQLQLALSYTNLIKKDIGKITQEFNKFK